MGRDVVSITIASSVSRHNSPQDDQDDKDWEDFTAEVEHLAADYTRRTGIHIDVIG